jgi:hypothetical protein
VRARAVAGAVPVWAWLTAIVAVSSIVRIVLARRIAAPWIMVDELIYSELAKSFAAHARFLVRGVPSNGYGFVYPILVAPAFRLFTSVPRAYGAAKDIDSVAMSLAAVPAYLLARRLVAPALALAVAVLTVLIPSMLYTGTLMTENAFYPLFVLACLALFAMLERPTAFRQVAVLVVCALCFATRAQAVALFGAAVVAPVLHGYIERDLRARLRRYAVLYGIVAAGVVLALAGTVARGRSPLSLLGAYRAATGPGYTVGSILKWTLWHVAELDLYVGVVGFAALLTLWLAPRAASPAARAFAAMSLPVVVLLVVEVAVFASRQSGRIEERNDFYLAPLFLTALVASVDPRAVPRRRRALIGGAVVAGVLPVTIPLGPRLINTAIVSDTLGLQPWWWLQDQGVHFGVERVVALVLALAAGAAFVGLPPRFAGALVVLTAVYLVLVGAVAENGRHGVVRASQGALFAGTRAPEPDWVDRRVGTAANVAFVWHWNAGETHPLWEDEFFNRSVGDVYTIGGPDPSDAGLPETPVHERADGVLVRADGSVPRVRYAISYTDLAGTVLRRDPIGLALYRVDGPMVIVTRVSGVYPDTWGRRRVTYHRYRCTGGFVAVRVGTDSQLFASDQVIRVRENGRTVRIVRVSPTAQPTFRVPLRPRHGICTVRFLAAQTRVPARVQPGNADTRALAAHYYAFEYSAR